MPRKIINKRYLRDSVYLSKFQNYFSIIKMASLTHALIGNGSKRSSSYSRESRLRLVRRECKPLSVTVGASNRSASDRKPISRASHPSKRREKNSSLFSLHLSYKCFVTFRNSRAYFSRFLERLVVKRNETKQFTPSRFSLSFSLSPSSLSRIPRGKNRVIYYAAGQLKTPAISPLSALRFRNRSVRFD